MKLNSHNNPPRNNGSKKGKDKQAQPVVKKKYDDSRTEKNKERNKAKQDKHKVIHTPHGTARALKRALQEEEKKKEQEHRHLILDDPRSHYMQLGLIKEVR